MGRTHLAITVELVSGGHSGNLWPRPGRVMIVARSTTFEQFATAIDDAFARWDRNHLHEFTFADGTPVSPASTWDGDEREGTLDGSKARLGKLRLGEQFAYVFDLGDNWQHLCTVAASLADPLETLGIIPDRPQPWWAGAASPTSTAATGTATTATLRPHPPPTG
jgi:Plasmid pRiA4b ORF-3-like protein